MLEFLRLGHKRTAAAWLCLSQIALSGVTRRHVERMPKQPCREAHVRMPPTNSQHQLARCVREPPWKPTLQPVEP